MPSERLGVGMVGAGSMARHHLGAWSGSDDAEIVAIFNRTKHKAEALADAFEIPCVCTEVSELLHRDDVDIVSIALPHHLHYPLSLAAIDAGKHVFCEKPLALCYQDAREMWERAEGARVKTGVQFSHRTSPALIAANEMIRDGYLGQLQYVACRWCFDWARDPTFPLLWRFQAQLAGAGALADLGVYAIDAARWLVGEFAAVCGSVHTYVRRRPLIPAGHNFSEVVRLAARGALPVSEGVGEVENDDECVFLATFENGAHGTFRTSRMHDDWGLRIDGSAGTLVWKPREDTLLARRADEGELAEISRTEGAATSTIVSQFIDNVRHDTDLPPTFYDGMKAQAVIDAVLRSAERRHWVPVPTTS